MRKEKGKKSCWLSKKGFLLFIPVILLIISLAIAILRFQSQNTYAASVNGEPISKEMFRQVLLRNTSQIYDYFKKKYGVDDNKDFWTTGYGGEVPVVMARERALDECIRVQVQLILARKKGLIINTSYSSFLKELDKENKRRKDAIEKGQPVYGVSQYNEQTFYIDFFTKLIMKLKEKFAENDLKYTEMDLNQYYEKIKYTTYKKADYIKIQKICISYSDKGEEAGKDTQNEAKLKIEEVKKKLDNGEVFENAATQFNPVDSEKSKYGEQIFGETSVRKISPLDFQLKSHAQNLSIGQISDIFEANNAYYIIKCVDKKSLGYFSFDEVKGNVKIKYVDQKYEELIDKFIKEAEVKINKRVYRSIMPR